MRTFATKYKLKEMTQQFKPLQSVGSLIKDFIVIIIGVIIYSFSWTGVILPAGGVGGGATGFSVLIYELTGGAAGGGIPIGVTFFIFNAVFLTICTVLLGAKFGIKTIFAILMTSVTMTLLQEILPEYPLGAELANDKLLSAILGGILSGVGVSVCLLVGGSTGGSDLVAMIVTHYYNLSYSQVVVALDAFIIGSSFFIFDSWAVTIYGFVTTGVFGVVSDAILSGNKQSLQIFVFSQKYEEIADTITHQIQRGVTVLDGTGWFSKQPCKVVMLVCRKSEMGMMMRTIKSIDNKAFISVANVMGVYGEGFDKYKMPKPGSKQAQIKPVKRDTGGLV